MIDIKRLNIDNIDENGKYIDVKNTIMLNLTDEQILALRKYHHNNNIAANRVIVKKMKLQKKNPYNKKRIRRYNNKIKKIIVINGIVIVLAGTLTSILYNKLSHKLQEQGGINENSTKTISIYIPEDTNVEIIEMPKNENELIEEKEEKVEEKLIRKYCSIYRINYQTVYNKLKELTNNFTSYEYLQKGHIPIVTCNRKEVYAYDNLELLFCTSVRAIKQLPEKFNLTEEELEINPPKYVNTMSRIELIDYYADVFEISEYRDLLYGIYMAETGGNSYYLVHDNNFGGLKNSNGEGFNHQDTWNAGAIEYVIDIKKYIDKGLDTIEQIQPTRTPDFENDVPQYLSNVHKHMEKSYEVYEKIDQRKGMSQKR